MPAPTPIPGPGRPRRASGQRSGGQRGRAERGAPEQVQSAVRAAPATGAGGSGGSRRHSEARERQAAPLRRVDETSAGGLVVDRTGPVARGALIGKHDRRGRLLWSLPKGHLELGETAEDAAVREVAEETGITGEIIGVLGTIDFWFVADRRRIHKTVHHYLMRAVSGTLSDEDVEVTEVAWVPMDELIARLAYPDERQLIGTATRLLDETA